MKQVIISGPYAIRIKQNKSLNWWNQLKYDVRNKLSYKYFEKSEPISLSEIKKIWKIEKDNINHWTDLKTI